MTRGGGWAVAPYLDAMGDGRWLWLPRAPAELEVTKLGVNVIPMVRRRLVF